jgi:hypothetical protein
MTPKRRPLTTGWNLKEIIETLDAFDALIAELTNCT